MTARELEERFVTRCAVFEITLEHALDKARRVPRLHITVDRAAQGGMRPETAADVNVIALDLLLTLFDLASQQAYVANVVMRARMMASREMNIHGTIEHNARFTPLRDILGMTLGVGRRKTAADIS